MTSTAVPTQTTALEDLRDAVRESGPIQPLEPFEYAAGHALFEAGSDQRAILTGWLVDRLAPRAAGPSRVLSIGCGDGTVDAAVAAALSAGGQRVEYVGVEPHGPSGVVFESRLAEIPGVAATVLHSPFAQAQPAGRYDVVLAVHSLYYVADLGDTLRRAHGLLAPGGELVVLHAPREPLNVLVGELAPGRSQPFAAELAGLLVAADRQPTLTRIDARLDLSETGDPETDRRLVEFTVQARLPAPLRRLVRAALAERALPGPGLLLPHPVDAVVVSA